MRIAGLKRRFVKSFCIKDTGIRAVDLSKAGVAFRQARQPLLLLQKQFFLSEKRFHRVRALMGANEEIVRRISL